MLLEFDAAGGGHGPAPPSPRAAPGRTARPALAAAGAANPALAVLSEALRGPLVPIIGFAQLLEAEAPPHSRGQRYADEIRAAAEGLLALLDAALAEAAGRAPPEGTPPAARAAGQDVVAAARSLLRDRGRAASPGDFPPARGTSCAIVTTRDCRSGRPAHCGCGRPACRCPPAAE